MTIKAEEKNLAVVVASLNSGGTERVAATIANYWSEKNINVVIVMLNYGQAVFYPVNSNIKIERLSFCKSNNPLMQFVELLGTIRSLRKILTHYCIDAQISFLPHVNIISILASIGTTWRVIVSERNDITNQQLSFLWRLVRRLVYHRAEMVTVNNQKNIPILKRFVPENKICWLPNPVGISGTPIADSHRVSRILAVGRLSRQKGFDVLLEAFEKTKCKHDGWTLEIIGKGPEDSNLREQIRSLGLTDRVFLKGVIKDIWERYSNSGMIIVPSRFEGMPNVLIEGMSMGIPPIITDEVGDWSLMLKEVSKEIVVPKNSVERLACAIDLLAYDPVERIRISREAIRLTSPFMIREAMQCWNRVMGL